MRKLLVVVDMQNDFISGSLGSAQAQSIVPNVKEKIAEYVSKGYDIVFTRDTHLSTYLETQEGKNLPVMHCIKGTPGHEIAEGLIPEHGIYLVVDKPTFGSISMMYEVDARGMLNGVDEVEFVGLCTDICVVSNALIFKADLPETKITVDAACCAGVTEESHKAALLTMKMCQVNVINEV